MVKYSEKELNDVFHALADSTRRGILSRLANGDAVVTEIAEPFEISLPAISKHLGVLEKAGLITRHKDGRIRRCQLNTAPLETAADWIKFYSHFWETRFDSLERFIENKQVSKVKSAKQVKPKS